ncbi:MAG: hypothetical protein R3E01_20200 [Pirellulaceae bacterium]|nr:hypothetical protein [Planctomycetales bacterium]
MNRMFVAICVMTILAKAASAQVPVPAERDYYTITPLPIPEGVVLESGTVTEAPDGRLTISSRRGDVYLVSNPLQQPDQMTFKKFASGLHEVLGVTWRDGALYVTQRCDVSRLRDTDGDDRADEFDVVCDDWEINGDYHEYAFGSEFDREGNIWVVLCLTGSFTSEVPYRGWCLRVTPDGKMIPTCSGIRSPGGIGMNCEGDMFYTDNQGPWNGTCGLKHLRPGSFQGNPSGNRWYELSENLGPRPPDPNSGSRMMVEAKRVPQLEPPAVYFPYKKMGQSASGIAYDSTAGRFGPFANQLFVGDQTNSTVMRVFLEKVQGHYQGACFPFLSGFGSGSLALKFFDEGALFVGGTNRGWGSVGPKPFALERVNWTGKIPFEIHEMRAKPSGFELTFTQPIDLATAADVSSYSLETYTYIYQSDYGSPEVDRTIPEVIAASVGTDGRSVMLTIDKLQEGHVHELQARGIRSRDDKQPLLHQEAYYTLNYLVE